MLALVKKIKTEKSQGFTLIEVVVSIVVIGILVSISVVSYGNWKQRTYISQAKSDLSQASSAFENYKNNNNAYPGDISKLTNFKSSNGISLSSNISANGGYYCVEAIADNDSSVLYHASSTEKGVQPGECPPHNWKDVGTGEDFGCGLSIKDVVYCWGSGGSGQLGNGASSSLKPLAIAKGAMPSQTVKSMSVGSFHVCVIGVDDMTYCWGRNQNGQLGIGNTNSSSLPTRVLKGDMLSQKVKFLSAGHTNTCVINQDDGVYCWGNNSNGLVGDGTTVQKLIPTSVAQGSMASQSAKLVSVGLNNVCAIGLDDKAYCWGKNNYGQLGDSTTAQKLIPSAVVQGDMSSQLTKSVSVGYDNTCVIGYDDRAYCWGRNYNGEIGNNSTSQKLVPAAVLQGSMSSQTVKSISVAYEHVCAKGVDDIAYCWGDNEFGQLGDKSSKRKLTPTMVSNGDMLSSRVKNVIAQRYTSCAIDDKYVLFCYGEDFGNIYNYGNSSANIYTKPIEMSYGSMALSSLKDISVGSGRACAIGADDKAYCWGGNGSGQLGNGTNVDELLPVAVARGAMPSETVKAISVGYEHACAIGFDDRAYCWGNNSYGALGDGTYTDKSVPTAVFQGARPSRLVKAIAAGTYYTCAIGFDDKIYCWGGGGGGQLGNGATTSRDRPVAVSQGDMPTPTAKSVFVSSGLEHTCAIGSDDKAYCWGRNNSGELGDGTNVNKLIPTAVLQGVMTSQSVKSLSLGNSYTCSVGFDDKTYCWGNNYYGQLGDGTNVAKSSPALVAKGSMSSQLVKKIIAGNSHACSIGVDDRAYCWGRGYSGQLGTGSTGDSNTPKQVMPSSPSGFSVKSISLSSNDSPYPYTCSVGIDDKGYCWGDNSMGYLSIAKGSIYDRNYPRLAMPSTY